MSSLAQTIDRTLSNIGSEPRDHLLDTIEGFENLELGDEERLAALATAIASCAVGNHNRHVAIYLDAIQVWALEVSAEWLPRPPRFRSKPDDARIEEGAELLIAGIGQMVESLTVAQAGLQDRLVAELAIFARLIGQHDANTILLTLRTVADGISEPGFRQGDRIEVPLRDTVMPSRTQSLATMPIRGVA